MVIIRWILHNLIKNGRQYGRPILALAMCIVIAASYLPVLPVSALDSGAAAEPGVDVPATDVSADDTGSTDADGAGEAADVTEADGADDASPDAAEAEEKGPGSSDTGETASQPETSEQGTADSASSERGTGNETAEEEKPADAEPETSGSVDNDTDNAGLTSEGEDDSAVVETSVLTDDGRNYRISVTYGSDAGVPAGAKLSVNEIREKDADYAEYVAKSEEALGWSEGSSSYVRLFDISIVDEDNNKVTISSPVDVKIELDDRKGGNGLSSDAQVVHFEDGAEAGDVVSGVTAGDNTVSFEAEGFSAYAIVEGPSELPAGWTQIKSIEMLRGESSTGLYIGTTGGYHMTNTTAQGSKDAATTGIVKTKPAQQLPPLDEAALYYFEEAGADNQFYVYCYDDNGSKQYVRNTGDANLTFADESGRTAFTVHVDNTGRFRFQNGSRYWNMWNGADGNHIAAWTNATDGNNYFYILKHTGSEDDPYGLDGYTYGLMKWDDGTVGKAMMASSKEAGDGRLDALPLTVMAKKGDNGDKLFVPDDSDITFWTFEWTRDGNKYHLTTVADGIKYYLSIGSDGRLTLKITPDDSCALQVTPGSGTHKGEISLKCNNKVLTYSGTAANGFNTGGSVGNEWLRLVEESELTDEYFMTYSARKVSISDENITNGSKIIIYTRDWNETTKKYEFYAIDQDGSLVRCYESGDEIQWVGHKLNTLLWDFAEYYWEGTTDPNFYYDFYNQYSEKYLAPQVAEGKVLADSPVGVNLNGRRDEAYYTPILAWDDENYSYVGLKVENGKIVSCPRSEAMDFYFAEVQDIPVDDTLTTVKTVDSTQYGITMRLANFGTRKEMSDFLGSDAGGAVNNTDPDLLSRSLGENGYPVTKARKDLSEWFKGADEVNHLFIESTFNASGYYEYDSSQNFASIQDDKNFKVYKEIGTVNTSGVHYQHGQFFPYNDIEAGVFSSASPKNLTTAGGSALPETDPRKYENLYLVKNQDYYLGMEIEAAFTQTPNGLDDWGHDIIYEFTGDDDFWLYVDGELIIDLGGIHNALSGSVNYRTGDVYVNGVHHTLRELFKENYKKTHQGASDAEVAAYLAKYFDDGSTIFRDYTTHTMKIFYLERGAGASNLHMKFNLASVKPGTVQLSKKLSGVEKVESVLAVFPYRIKYRKEDGSEHVLKNALPDTPEQTDNYVFYKGTNKACAYKQNITVEGVTYNDVFLLNPDEEVEINFPEDAVSYSITECGVDTGVYSQVKANGDVLTGTSGEGYPADRKDYGIDYAAMSERARVVYDNKVDPAALRTMTVTKTVYKEDGTTVAENDTTEFSFRLYMATELEEGDEIPAANMHTYHVRDKSRVYCKWNVAQQKLVPLESGHTEYSDLTEEELRACTFTTSINGSISKIPAGYTVEVRDVLAGTQFRLVERPTEIPDGYAFQKYEYPGYEPPSGRSADQIAMDGVSDTVRTGEDPAVKVCNLRGYGLRVNKVWTDKDYMEQRDPVYFAVYTKDKITEDKLNLVEGTVRIMNYGESTLYWYFLPLPVDVPFNDYEIREVKLTEPITHSEDDKSIITGYSSIDIIEDGGTVTLNGTQKGETGTSEYEYTVGYRKGTVEPESNVRVDTVTNSRKGLLIKKTDWQGNALAGAGFTFRRGEAELGKYTSGTDGTVTQAYLSKGTGYGLTENKAPASDEIKYQGLPAEMTITFDGEKYAVEGVDEKFYTLDQGSDNEMPVLTIRNRPYTFKAVKIDGDTGDPLEDVTFQLLKQHTVDGKTQFDPVAGYENLVTLEDGIIPKIDNALGSGVYQLAEKSTVEGYEIISPVRFVIDAGGHITLDKSHSPDGVTLEAKEKSDGSSVDYVLTIPNSSGAVLPDTGGIGTHVLYIAGVLLIVASAAGMIRARRKDRRA